jgi:hypothetical protein
MILDSGQNLGYTHLTTGTFLFWTSSWKQCNTFAPSHFACFGWKHVPARLCQSSIIPSRLHFLRTNFTVLVLSKSTMPQSPGILTATAAIAKDRAGHRGQAPAPRHERSQLPDDVPDVSVGVNHHPCYGYDLPVSPTHTASSGTLSALSQTNQDTANRYEAILLGPGENKIDVEVDTRKSLVDNHMI